jgi:hypothetical protein
MIKTLGWFVFLFYCILSADQVFRDIIPGRIFVVDDQGYMYTDQDDHTICKFSPAGELLLRIGKPGEGPGDIKRFGNFYVNPVDNTIYVTEFFGGNKWISRFSKEGKFLGEWKCALDREKWKPLNGIKFDSKGNVFLETITIRFKKLKDFQILGTESNILRFFRDGKQIGQSYNFLSDLAIANQVTQVMMPFHNELHFEIFTDKLIIKEDNDDFVGIYNADGKLKEKINIPFKREKLNEKDKISWQTYFKESSWAKEGIANGWLDLKFFFERMPYPEFKPVTDSMLLDTEGFLYIRKFNRFEKGENLWAKINMDNRNITIVKTKEGEKLLAIRKNSAFITREDENGDDILIKTDKKNFFIEHIKKNNEAHQ